MGLKQWLVGLLGSLVTSEVAIRATSPRLRIVAYYGISNPEALEQHLNEYAEPGLGQAGRGRARDWHTLA